MVHVYNPVGTGVTYNLDLITNNHKLMNLNSIQTDRVTKGNKNIYETYGNIDKFFFVDLKICFGDVKIQFFEKNYEDIAQNNFVKYKTIKDNNSYIHYIKANSTRMFIKV